MKKKQFPIMGMHCASCALTIERALKTEPGVKGASVNFASEIATVESEDDVDEKKLKEAVAKTGYELVISEDGASAEGVHGEHIMPGGEKMKGEDMHDHHRMLKEAEIRLLKIKFAVGAV